MTSRSYAKYVALIGALLPSACIGPANAPSPQLLPATTGIFIGTSALSEAAPIFGIVSETGYALFSQDDASGGFVYAIDDWNPYSSSIAYSYNAYAYGDSTFLNSATIATGSMNGSGNPQASLSGMLATSDGSSESFSVAYQKALYEMPASIGLIQGSYSVDSYDSRGDPLSILLSVVSNGGVSGSDNKGCIYGGSLSVTNSMYNVYSAAITRDCSDTSELYSGLASLFPGQDTTPTTLHVILAEATFGVHWRAVQQ